MRAARRAGALAVMVAATVAAGELAARVGTRWLARTAVSGPAVDAETLPAPPGKVIQPFVGFVRHPGLAAPAAEIPPTNAQGLRRWPQDDGATSAYTVAILGSSVAERFSYGARQTLLAELAAQPVFAGRTLAVRNYAVGGFKQPQQLAMLTQLLANGEHPDLVVEIDSGSEVALAVADNLRHGIHPLYPRMWAGLVDPLAEPGSLELFGELALLRHRRDRTAGWCSGLLEHSALCRLVRTAALASLDQQSAALARDLADVRRDGRSFQRFGPPYPARAESEVYADLAGHWARCSVLMADLCRARGVRYVQVLAPNQYVSGSKPMRSAERDAVYHPSTGYGPFLELGYPFLIAQGRSLGARGVPFHDLTGIFRNTERPAYIDDCCHLNALGNAILGQAIARAVVADLGTATP